MSKYLALTRAFIMWNFGGGERVKREEEEQGRGGIDKILRVICKTWYRLGVKYNKPKNKYYKLL